MLRIEVRHDGGTELDWRQAGAGGGDGGPRVGVSFFGKGRGGWGWWWLGGGVSRDC